MHSLIIFFCFFSPFTKRFTMQFSAKMTKHSTVTAWMIDNWHNPGGCASRWMYCTVGILLHCKIHTYWLNIKRTLIMQHNQHPNIMLLNQNLLPLRTSKRKSRSAMTSFSCSIRDKVPRTGRCYKRRRNSIEIKR